MSFFHIFFFILGVSCESIKDYTKEVTKQMKIASRHQPEDNFIKSVETVITTANSVDKENFSDNELKKLFLKNFKLYEKIDSKKKNDTLEMMRQRKSRDALNNTDLTGLECLSCFADGISTEDENCYKGSRVNTEKCSGTKQCYTELHPLYIKRGCFLPGRLNRTFVCKCPLCNDKPAYDSTYYEYTGVGDWEYDNKRLQKPVMGLYLICKVCETKGVNKTTDTTCKFGQNADYKVCAHNQLCYVNIDNQFNYVSRGCINKPIFNPLHHFCDKNKCNSVSYPNNISVSPSEIMLRTYLTKSMVSRVSYNPFPCFIALSIVQILLLKPLL